MDLWIEPILGILACWAGAALASAIETALVGLPSVRVHSAIDQKVRGARQLLYWLRQPSRILATLHLLRSALTIGAGYLALSLTQAMGWDLPQPLLVIITAMVTLVACHVVPRTLAKRFPMEIGTRTMWFVMGLTGMLVPFTWFLGISGRWIGRWLHISPEEAGPFWTPDELTRLTTHATASSLGEGGEELFLSIIEFSDTVIREIMVPRTDMVTVPITASREELQQVVLDAGHSRVPVYDDTIDNIVGILHVKDLFLFHIRAMTRPSAKEAFSLKALLRSTFYVPEVMKISELLREFQRRKTHMAIVVDEYGGTAGVVTLEDIIEEIVGEIHDEYDVEEKQYRVVGDKIIADGRVSIWDLEEALGVEFPSDGDYETLAGFLMSRTGTLPETGMTIDWETWRFVVKEANEKRIGTVEIERAPAPAP